MVAPSLGADMGARVQGAHLLRPARRTQHPLDLLDPQHVPALEEPAPARLTHPLHPLPVSHHPDPLQGSSRSCCTPAVKPGCRPQCHHTRRVAQGHL